MPTAGKMGKQNDLELILKSRIPIVAIESREESRILDLLKGISFSTSTENYVPLFRWTITDGLQRLDIDLEPQLHNAQPADVLKHIRAVKKSGIYVLLDFHPYLEDPVNVRLLKDICIRYEETARTIVLISHTINIPRELESFTARFELAMPTDEERREIVKRIARQWTLDHPGSQLTVDAKAHDLLIKNLAGLTARDTEVLARNAVYHDGAISASDLPDVMQAKYELLNKGGTLQFEYDTVKFSDVGGLQNLKDWLSRRKVAFIDSGTIPGLDTPKGIMLIGVQGCGKSLAAKATAGILGIPLLRLDFGALYNKYHGETERNLRESLKTADIMAPCVLWIDEIEKGLAGRGGETGTTQRVLGTFLTWMSEKNSAVFVVATANDITELPPELVRKGRFDEIFFVDLPIGDVRMTILKIHLQARNQDPDLIDLRNCAIATRGFSGAEIEQVVVSALYAAHAQNESLGTRHLLLESSKTKPLSVVMAERIDQLRQWADGRTVSASE